MQRKGGGRNERKREKKKERKRERERERAYSANTFSAAFTRSIIPLA
jgi:hypothetical protein